MRKFIIFLALSGLFSLPPGATAQSSSVPQPGSVSAWLGALSCGGSLTGSSANTLGGAGHFSLGATAGLARPSLVGAAATASAVTGILQLGIFEGFDAEPLIHGLGSLDCYIRAGRFYLKGDNSTNANLWGLGVRLGLLRNSIITPAVSLTLGYHKTGGLALGLAWKSPVPLHAEAEGSTVAFRCEASKNLFLFTPILGLGVNKNRAKVGSLGGNRLEGTRSEAVYYAGLEWNILIVRLGLEVGRTGNETFGTLGARITL